MRDARPFAPLRVGAYGIIVCDPPWNFRARTSAGYGKSAQAHYDCMPIDKIMTLPVAALAAKDCALLLWATAPMLDVQLCVLRAWGFTYKSRVSWAKKTASGKSRMGPGYWSRTMHEDVLIGTVGSPKALRLPSLIGGVAREHSRKPDAFYDLIKDRSPGVARADLFSRETRRGFDGWGDQHGKFDPEEAR